MKVTLLQTNPQDQKVQNLNDIAALSREAVEYDRPDLLVFPEYFNSYGGSPETKLAAAEDLNGSASYEAARAIAREHGVWVHAGSVMETIPGDKRFYNTTVVFDRSGKEVARYRKIHLFDITNVNGTVHKESDLIKPGEEVVTYDLEGMKVGCVICYDIRFPELFLRLTQERCGLIVVPAAFTLHTGMDHWEVILRARALETQAYVAACGQWGKNMSNGVMRETYGNSMVIDPWGHVVAHAPNGVGFITGRVEPARVDRVRGLIPLNENRRLI